MSLRSWFAIAQAVRGRTRPWLELLARAGSPDALAALPDRAFLEVGLDEETIRRFRAPDAALSERWRGWLEGEHRALETFGSPGYPPLLAELHDAPLVLWLEGAHPELLASPQLAIVGSRNPTGSGRQTAEQFARYLSERGLTITSGLAIGIDGASHRGALYGIGRTVAVLGSGLDIVYPREHRILAREIIEHGLLVSEYPPGVAPQRHHFPHRNRIIAGLAVGTLVVEATRRSGSLSTAQHAADNGREVFAIPGSIHNPLARGCHALIRQGAKLVEEANDVLVELAPLLGLELVPPPAGPEHSEKSNTASNLFEDSEYRKLADALDFAPISIADLGERTGLTAAELSSMLLVLELEGFVEALPGARYSRLAKRS